MHTATVPSDSVQCMCASVFTRPFIIRNEPKMRPKCSKIGSWGAPGHLGGPLGYPRGSPEGLWGSFWYHFGSILGSKMMPKTIKHVIQNLNTFWTTFWSGFDTLRPSKVSIWLGRSFKNHIFTFFSFCQFLEPLLSQKGSILASKGLLN